MARVFVTRLIPSSGIAMLGDAFGDDAVRVFEHDCPIERQELLEAVSGIEALLPLLTDKVDAEVMDAAGQRLRIVANYAVGYNNVDVAAATKRGIAVTNTPGVLTETTADLAWALLMAAARRIGEAERFLRAGQWKAWGPQMLLGVDVHGKTLGIFGMGRIGQAVARRAKGFGMRVIYHDVESLSPTLAAELEATWVEKTTLVAESDFVSIHCPLLPETTHAFGAREFAAMKDSACIVNTARGPVIDETALVAALRSGEIAAAGLDVYENEPVVHPGLLECQNAVLGPHIGSASRETRSRMAEMAAGNIVAMLTGEIPPNCVNPKVLK